MKKIFAALAVLGIVLGTTTLITPAHRLLQLRGNQNKANNQGNTGRLTLPKSP